MTEQHSGCGMVTIHCFYPSLQRKNAASRREIIKKKAWFGTEFK